VYPLGLLLNLIEERGYLIFLTGYAHNLIYLTQLRHPPTISASLLFDLNNIKNGISP
jgi:hypothetical protein